MAELTDDRLHRLISQTYDLEKRVHDLQRTLARIRSDLHTAVTEDLSHTRTPRENSRETGLTSSLDAGVPTRVPSSTH